jgi:hypothetical protein
VFVAEFIFGAGTAGVVAGGVGAAAVWSWYLQPLRRRQILHRRAAGR